MNLPSSQLGIGLNKVQHSLQIYQRDYKLIVPEVSRELWTPFSLTSAVLPALFLSSFQMLFLCYNVNEKTASLVLK